MRARCLLAVGVTSVLLARPLFAQESASSGVTGALERFQPSPAGDAQLGVLSPWVEGHLALQGPSADPPTRWTGERGESSGSSL